MIAYIALDWISYLYPLAPFAITPWNPPPGLSVALLTIAGLRFWPAVLIAVLLAEILVRGGGSHPLSTTATSLAFAVGYVGVAAFLQKVVRFDPRLKRVRDVVWLVAGAVNGSVVIAGVYVGSLVVIGALVPQASLAAGVRLWVGDAIGIIVTAPLIMLLVARDPPFPFEGRWVIPEVAIQSFAVVAVLLAVFVIGKGNESSYFYLLFLPLIWISLRHGLRGAVLCLVVIQIGLIIGFQYSQHTHGDVLELQLLMLAIAITGLMLGSAVSERQDALEALGTREAEL
ncbi:MAG: MASE1 domain-containing protein, partial [Burkholderiales bacterium]